MTPFVAGQTTPASNTDVTAPYGGQALNSDASARMCSARCCCWSRAMRLTMMKCKLHRAVVTQADLHYEGSISIDRDFLEAAGLLPNEQVDVLNINNGERFTTYAIEAPRGSRTFGINGAAARLAQVGDRIIVVAYAQMEAAEAEQHDPAVVLFDEHNQVIAKPKAA
jgi:aspartate 1-decarboxylase